MFTINNHSGSLQQRFPMCVAHAVYNILKMFVFKRPTVESDISMFLFHYKASLCAINYCEIIKLSLWNDLVSIAPTGNLQLTASSQSKMCKQRWFCLLSYDFIHRFLFSDCLLRCKTKHKRVQPANDDGCPPPRLLFSEVTFDHASFCEIATPSANAEVPTACSLSNIH